jgi:hypothetical protein
MRLNQGVIIPLTPLRQQRTCGNNSPTPYVYSSHRAPLYKATWALKSSYSVWFGATYHKNVSHGAFTISFT